MNPPSSAGLLLAMLGATPFSACSKKEPPSQPASSKNAPTVSASMSARPAPKQSPWFAGSWVGSYSAEL
ncbi:MAG TPA: hypothetical protein VGP93_05790, partial [Polyangiaceae bacterium]|nr:hypothetical protein [Polyangiaceae bacterium]